MLQEVNKKSNLSGGSYDVTDGKGHLLFTVTFDFVEDPHYYDNGQIIQEITGVKAHFDTQGEDAKKLLEAMQQKEKIERAERHRMMRVREQARKRKADPKWNTFCQAAKILQKGGFKKQAQQLIITYMREYS